jgi:hypothetical protein
VRPCQGRQGFFVYILCELIHKPYVYIIPSVYNPIPISYTTIESTRIALEKRFTRTVYPIAPQRPIDPTQSYVQQSPLPDEG